MNWRDELLLEVCCFIATVAIIFVLWKLGYL